MSFLSRETRALLAARLIDHCWEMHAFAEEADAGFDGGEFSGSAHAYMKMREEIDICTRLRTSRKDAVNLVMRRYMEQPDEPDDGDVGTPSYRRAVYGPQD